MPIPGQGRVSPALRRYMPRRWDEADDDYRRQLLDAVPPLPPGGRMLDVGCDDGEWTSRVAERAGATPDRVAGIEILDARRELALARGYDVRPADLDERWPFDDDSFDLVHANQVIEHVHGLDHFVAEVRRVLRPGGRAVICTENLSSWHNVAALAMGWMPFSLSNISATGTIGNPMALHGGEEPAHGPSWQHTRVLSLEGLKAIMRAHGMAVDGSFASGYHPAVGRLARALARRDQRHAHFIGVVVSRTA